MKGPGCGMAGFSLRDDGDRYIGETFIDRYVAWARTQTDSPPQFHQIAAVVILSAIMSAEATLPTAYNAEGIRPNIWAMILAGTTITRKSTTMDMAVKILDDCHPDYLMGTDGSPEGLLGEMALRDGKVSLFHRDEITGFMEAATQRDYMSGLLESMTRLYDGRREKRILRREVIEIKKPRLVILSGGIASKMAEITKLQHIQSGFIPRFIIVKGTTNVNQMREIGPPTFEPDLGLEDPREKILQELFEIVNFWIPQEKTQVVTVGGLQKKVKAPKPDRKMKATPEAWERIRKMQRDAMGHGERSHSRDVYMPIFQRMGDSIIKVAMLIAGSENRQLIEFEDVCSAIRYSDPWIAGSIEFAKAVEDNPDFNPWEKKAMKIASYIQSVFENEDRPASRSDVMKKFHVRQKDIDDIEKTLIARGEIKVTSTLYKDSRSKKPRIEYNWIGPNTIEGATYVADTTYES